MHSYVLTLIIGTRKFSTKVFMMYIKVDNDNRFYSHIGVCSLRISYLFIYLLQEGNPKVAHR